MRLERIKIGGRVVRYWRGGTGPALLLLHGGIGDAWLHWQRNLEPLSANFDVIAPDLPAFGGSEPLPDFSFRAVVKWLDDFLEALGIESLDLVGNSFGGAIARLYAANYPGRVRRLVLVDGGRIFQLPAPVEFVLRVPAVSKLVFGIVERQAFSMRTMRNMISDESLLTPQFLAESRRAMQSFGAMVRQGFRSTGLPDRRVPLCPTLVIWGALDQLQPVSSGRKVAAEIEKARFVIIEKAGHLPQLEQPARFLYLLLDFLTSP